MKLWDVAWKDLWRSFRSAFFLVFGLVLPLLTATIFYFAFGGAGDEEGFTLPQTSVWVVNQDQAGGSSGGFSVGQALVQLLQSEAFAELFQVTESGDPEAARLAVDGQQAGLAILIPQGLTAAVVGPGGQAAVELYQDPTLTVGPSIVRAVVGGLLDGFSGGKIAAQVASQQLAARGIALDPSAAAAIAVAYGEWARELGSSWGQGGTEGSLLDIRLPSSVEETDTQIRILSMVMSGMMVFYVFFSGAASAESILREEEDGTLPRLFTTPTPLLAILGGKCLSVFALLVVQVAVLLASSALIFGIDWGDPLGILLVGTGTVVLSAGFGILMTSLLKNTRQSGIMFGGVLTVLGMVGMISIFTGQAAAGEIATVSFFVPHGWSLRGWQLLLRGGGAVDLWTTVLIMLGLGVACFGVGLWRFRKRYA